MTRVLLTSKQARSNHRHEFRPTGDARLRGGEHRLGQALEAALAEFPVDVLEDGLRGRLSPVQVAEESLARIDPEPLQRAMYDIWAAEAADAAARITVEINRELIRRGSVVRVRTNIVKAKNVNLKWDVDLPSFDRAPAASAGIATARTQSGLTLANLGRQQAAMIGTQVEAGFTTVQQFAAVQPFTAGRVVTGRTTGQTARAVFDILSDTTPAQMVLTPADAAAYRGSFTNGLFPRWATAVNRHADTVAGQLADRGVTGARARGILDRRTRAYGDRLRRSRARMIARTETNIIQNLAQQDMMNQAQASGLVGPAAQKEWVTGPFDVCDLCQALGGQRVPIQGAFSTGHQRPPRHPNCRCIIRMVPNLSGAPQRFGLGVPGDPFRYVFADGWQAGVTPVAGFPAAAAPVVVPPAAPPVAPPPRPVPAPGPPPVPAVSPTTAARHVDDPLAAIDDMAARTPDGLPGPSELPVHHSHGPVGRLGLRDEVIDTGDRIIRHDRHLRTLREVQGFDDLPDVVPNAVLDDLIDQGGTEIMRGEAAEEFMDALKGGDFYPGQGIYGHGQYFDSLPRSSAGDLGNRLALVNQYVGRRGVATRAVLKPDARTLTGAEAQEAARVLGDGARAAAGTLRADPTTPLDFFVAAASGHPDHLRRHLMDAIRRAIDTDDLTILDELAAMTGDPGYAAATLGYDAIVGADFGGSYMVVLNRQAVAFADDVITADMIEGFIAEATAGRATNLNEARAAVAAAAG